MTDDKFGYTYGADNDPYWNGSHSNEYSDKSKKGEPTQLQPVTPTTPEKRLPVKADPPPQAKQEAPKAEQPKHSAPPPQPKAAAPPPPRKAPPPPAPPSRRPRHWFDVSGNEWRELFHSDPDPEGRNKFILFMVAGLFTPITFVGALLGYVRGFERFMQPLGEPPKLAPLSPPVRVAMILGAVLVWVLLIGLLLVGMMVVGGSNLFFGVYFLMYFAANLLLSLGAWAYFKRWQKGIRHAMLEGGKYGTARFARPDELTPYMGKAGFYIGGDYTFSDKGHILTVAGTRGGKGTNLIIPNLLGMGGYQGSWVVIDPKGENAAITARYQRQSGQNVVVINPWGLLSENLGAAQSYNPMNILTDRLNINIVDDAQMIAEMVIPIDPSERDKFFTDNARAVLSGLILHLALIQPLGDAEKKTFAASEPDYQHPDLDVPPATLTTLWKWLRLPKEKWRELIEDMHMNDFPEFGDVVKQSAFETEKLMTAGEKTWGGIIASALQATNFLKSPALQKSLEDGFDAARLANGKTTLYVIIPADKLHTHARWLRLVTTTTMRAVVRKPNKRVCFLLDEFSALGYLPEIETALSTYAGFEITVWPILQSLIQLKAHYEKTWETFIGNSTVRQYFSVNDNFTADYVSKAIGQTSHVMTEKWRGVITNATANQRFLVTSDELRRASADYIFAFISGNPVTYFRKRPYYENFTVLPRADDNPYIQAR